MVSKAIYPYLLSCLDYHVDLFRNRRLFGKYVMGGSKIVFVADLLPFCGKYHFALYPVLLDMSWRVVPKEIFCGEWHIVGYSSGDLSYDTSYYHIDKVREPMIWFLFLQSMLLGAYFRINANNIQKVKREGMVFLLFGTLVLYFVSKMLFAKDNQYSEYQLINQVILFGVLFLFFKVFMSLERAFQKMPRKLHSVARFLADHTLEIYLVQYVIIAKMNYGPFPVNWVIVSLSIMVAAVVLRYVSQFVLNRITKYE